MFLAVKTLKSRLLQATASTEVTSLQQSRDDNNVSKVADMGGKMYFVVLKRNSAGFTMENKDFIQHKPI